MRLGTSSKNLIIAVVALASVGCREVKWLADRLFAEDAKWEAVEWTILAHRAADERDGRPLMYWIRADGDGTHGPLAPDLAGFEPRWGVEYRIEVKLRETNSGALGVVSGWRSFERVVSETPRGGTEFRVPSIGAPWFGEDRRTFIDGQAFTCRDPATCAKLDELTTNPAARVDLAMRHGENPGVVELLDVEPAAP